MRGSPPGAVPLTTMAQAFSLPGLENGRDAARPYHDRTIQFNNQRCPYSILFFSFCMLTVYLK